MTSYNAPSENGRHLLLTSTGKRSLKAELDALATVAKAKKNLQALGNPSGTGRFMTVASGAGGTAGAIAAGNVPAVIGTIGAAIASSQATHALALARIAAALPYLRRHRPPSFGRNPVEGVALQDKPRQKRQDNWLLIKSDGDTARSADDPNMLEEQPQSV